jgi:hypothetical protein
MALAQSMKNFVNDLKASRRSRHEFVKGNKASAKNLMKENRQFLADIREQNKMNAQQTHMFLKSAKETRMANFKEAKAAMKISLDTIHQSTLAIKQGAHGMINEFREDNKLAHKYWASLQNDTPIEDPIVDSEPKKSKKSEKSENTVNVIPEKDEIKEAKQDKPKLEKEQMDQTENG